MRKFVLTIFLTMITFLEVQANVTLSSASYQKKIEINKSGERVFTWVKAQKVVPGTVVRYINRLENNGDNKANKLVVDNPIPKNMEYVKESASCTGVCEIFYSVDGGKSFKKPSQLFLGVGKKRHLAEAKEYTNIRWIIDVLDAKSKSSVEYKARLK